MATPERLKYERANLTFDLRKARRWQQTRQQCFLPSPAGATNTVDVLFYVSWEIIIKDVGYIDDVQAAGRQVCGHQDTNTIWKFNVY